MVEKNLLLSLLYIKSSLRNEEGQDKQQTPPSYSTTNVAHEKTSPKNQPKFSLMMMRQYWLGQTNPKQAIRST